MAARNHLASVFLVFVAAVAGCSLAGVPEVFPGLPAAPSSAEPIPQTAPTTAPSPTASALPATPTPAPPPTATEVSFDVGQELTIEYLRGLEIRGSQITFERELTPTFYYERHLVSYLSEGNKIYGLLTIPREDPPESGFKAIVFNHGYIPPSVYRTTERYTAYVDSLARNGFVVFKVDYRGHGQSAGEASGSYFSPGYTIDAIAALKSLQRLDFVDADGIGMWGHSMAGNLTLRAMLIEPDVKAGVIWGGAVYSYSDFTAYGIDDNTYRPPADREGSDRRRRSREIFDTYGRPDTESDYWRAVSLTENIDLLSSPLQLHHAQDDPVVNIAYSEDLAAVLLAKGKESEFFTYEGGGHNLISPYYGQAMRRTVEFFRQHL